MRELQITNRKFTCFVAVDDGDQIVEAAPVIRKFVGQRLSNLVSWMRKFGQTDVLVLNPDE